MFKCFNLHTALNHTVLCPCFWYCACRGLAIFHRSLRKCMRKRRKDLQLSEFQNKCHLDQFVSPAALLQFSSVLRENLSGSMDGQETQTGWDLSLIFFRSPLVFFKRVSSTGYSVFDQGGTKHLIRNQVPPSNKYHVYIWLLVSGIEKTSVSVVHCRLLQLFIAFN